MGTGYPLVLLHGWGWHSGIFLPIASQLAQHFQVFLIDLPGCGKSSLEITDYTIESLATTLCKHLPEQAIWLGWSLGGMIAWWVALHHPTAIKQLITVSSSPRFIADDHWPGVAPAALHTFQHRLLNDYEKTLKEFLELQLRGSLVTQEWANQLYQIHQDAHPCHAALLGGLSLLTTLDLRNDLSHMTCPSLHIFGSLDVLVPKNIVPILKPKLPHSQFAIIQRAGHIPFLTHQTIFIDLLHQWI
jgi:pimeloyl-[acyl-carrier protein] methyl ester esterase